MQTYTIKNVKPTGKESHPTYGTEYYVKFEEDERVVKASRKQEPQIGDSWEGDIKDDRYGAKFVKAPFVPGSQPVAKKDSWVPGAATTHKPAYKDNSDGMRQGMCFNNAANFINQFVTVQDAMDAEGWANTVFEYAKALYLKGDLNAQAPVAEDVVAPVPENLDDIAALFGAEAPAK